MRSLLTFALLSLTAAAASAAAEKKLNILFLFADDWGRYASAYAAVDGKPSPNEVVKTPNVDRIAANGVIFRSAFVNAPSCTPCRSSMLSGRYFFNTGRGAILNGAVWDGSVPSWPERVHEAGYHMGESHKVWSPGSPNDAPFGSGKWAYEKAGRRINNYSEEVTRMMAEGKSAAAASEELFAEVRGNFSQFLSEAKPGQPWCYFYGPTNVHRQWVKGSGKAIWGIDPESLKGRMPKHLPDVPEVREDFADYLGEIQAFDAEIGLHLKMLEERGELERTVIVTSGDHGAPGFPGGKCNLYDFGIGVTLAAWYPGGKGGRVVDDLVMLPDLAPTFVEIAGGRPLEGIPGRSLMPQLTSERSGIIEENRSWVLAGRERHVSTARPGNLPYPQRCLRTRDFLYIRNFMPDRWPLGEPRGVTETSAPPAEDLENNTYAGFADMDASPTKAWLVAHRQEPQWRWHYDYAFAKRPLEELYDLRKDPGQLTNIAADPAYAENRAALEKQLLDELKRVQDPRVTEPGDTFEKAPFVDPKEQIADKRKNRAKGKAKAKAKAAE
jgi:N-sulfoglucosamine sulfohydrolase